MSANVALSHLEVSLKNIHNPVQELQDKERWGLLTKDLRNGVRRRRETLAHLHCHNSQKEHVLSVHIKEEVLGGSKHRRNIFLPPVLRDLIPKEVADHASCDSWQGTEKVEIKRKKKLWLDQ